MTGRIVCVATLVIACQASVAAAQATHDIRLADKAGTWRGTFMIGANDSVVATLVLRATAGRDGWTLTLPDHDPLPTRVVAVGGDSVVTETGPYPSTRRPGQTVTTRITGHYHGARMVGTFVAHYTSGDTRGKVAARLAP